MRILLALFLFFSVGFAEDIQTLKLNAQGPNRIGVLSIGKDRSIDQTTYLYVKFALEHFKKVPVSFVLLELNTPGGEIFAAMKIADLLKKSDEAGIPVIAFIDDWAISAGAMLAYSCRYIGIVNTASMGAAEPVTVGEDGKMETASEKVNSALRSEMANRAGLYGRNPLIAEAMVDKDLTLVLRDGEIMKVEESLQGDETITKKGKLLTLNAKDMLEYGIADFETDRSFFENIPGGELIFFSDWKIDFFSFLSHPLIASLLMMGFLIGGYMELNHPGMILPGVVSASCLGMILLSHFSVEAIHWLEPLIFFTGVALLLVEIFLIPGFGFTGIIGIILTLFGLFTLTFPYWNEMHWTVDSKAILERIAYFSGTLILSLMVIILCIRPLFHRFFVRNRLVLADGIEEKMVSDFPSVGIEAIAHTPLRPAGKIRIAGEIFDALSEREFIEKDAAVQITRLEGNKIFVR